MKSEKGLLEGEYVRAFTVFLVLMMIGSSRFSGSYAGFGELFKIIWKFMVYIRGIELGIHVLPRNIL